jgi:hypothetical protein
VERAQEATPGGATDGDLGGGVHARAPCVAGGLGRGLYQAPHHLEPGGMEVGRVATPVGVGGAMACGPRAGEELAHTTQAHGNTWRPLAPGAVPTRIGVDHPEAEILGGGSPGHPLYGRGHQSLIPTLKTL